MLDWLNGDGQCSGVELSQIHEAPETPAPLFAYRALKGILFGSPDYDSEDENKENVAPVQLAQKVKESDHTSPRALRGDSSPLQTKASQTVSSRTRDAAPTSPSPRKRPQLSPTKSILRTPGIPTPRRPNINVTFKDIRASLSPVAHTTNPLPPSSPSKKTTTRTNSTREVAQAQSKALTGGTNDAGPVEPLPTPVYEVSSVDAYLQSTEREMKRLVRYSQKMREYARRGDQENVALRKQRDKLKREVEKLKTAQAKGQIVSNHDCVAVGVDVKESGLQSSRNRSRKGTSEKQNLTTEYVGSRQHVEGEPTHREKHTNARSSGWTAKEQSSKAAQSGKIGHAEGRSEVRDTGQTRRLTPKRRAASMAQLPPDRLAAAKERLRVKSEERRRALNAAM